MIKNFKILLNIVRHSLHTKARGVLHGRYFAGVEFVNKNNIVVNENSWIESGSRLWVTNPTKIDTNICIEGQCWIGRDVEIQAYYGSNILVKENVSIQDRCKILGSVYIGQDCLLAPDVFLSSGNHYYNYLPELPIKQQDKLAVGTAQDFMLKSSPIVIEEDCWLGKNSIVMKGVNVGRGAVIGANSFVNMNVPPYEVWAGTPARFIKKRLDFKPPLGIQFDKMENRPYFYRGFEHRNADNNGFPSSNSSVCVLETSNKASLFLSGEIYVEGELKIWRNDCLIFNSNMMPGSFAEILFFTENLNSNPVSALYQDLSNEIKKNLCVVFEFKARERETKAGFSINKIEQRD